MNEKCNTLWSGLKKSLNFSLSKKQAASSHISLAQGNCLLVLANDLVSRWRALTLAHQVRLKCYLSNQEIFLSQTTRRNFFRALFACLQDSVFISKKIDRQWSGLEYFTPHWIAKWIISVLNKVSVWKPQDYTFTQTAFQCSGWGGGDVQCTSGWLGKKVMFWNQRVRNPDSAISFSYSF